MKRSLIGVVAILALALSAPVMAQTEQSASGTIVSSTSTQIVIKTEDGRQMTFMTDSNTNRPSDLRQGSTVTIRYHDINGTFHAANVTASAGPTSDAPTNSTTATTGTSSPTGTTGVTGTQAGSTAPGTSATSANAQERATTADPTGNEARPQQDTTGTRTTGTTTGTTTATSADQDTGTTRLPATASPLPLMGLSGLLALAGGLATRAIRRRK